MIEQILKYLSPIAILGLVWGIIQFYQKRSHIKSDLKREEIRSTYKEIDIIIKDIKNEYWKLFAVIAQTSLVLGKQVNRLKNEKNISEDKLELSEFKSESTIELQNSHKILETIEKEGYNEKKHKTTLQEQLKLAEKRKIELESAKKEAKKELAELKAEKKKLSIFLESDDQKLLDKTKEAAKALQELILDLNKISLVDIDDKHLLKSLIFDLTYSIQKLINELEAEDKIDRINILELIRTEELEETMYIIHKIDKHIYKIQ